MQRYYREILSTLDRTTLEGPAGQQDISDSLGLNLDDNTLYAKDFSCLFSRFQLFSSGCWRHCRAGMEYYWKSV